MLYAWALDELLRNATRTQTLTDEEIYNIARDGSRIIETIIKNGSYKSKTIRKEKKLHLYKMFPINNFYFFCVVQVLRAPLLRSIITETLKAISRFWPINRLSIRIARICHVIFIWYLWLIFNKDLIFQ